MNMAAGGGSLSHAQAVQAGSEVVSGTQTRILLVEDDPVHAEWLADALTEQGRHVSIDTVTTGHAFLDRCQHDDYDAAIIDFLLPDCDAPTLIARAEPWLDGVPALVVSCAEGQDVVIKSMRRGAVDFVPKADALKQDVLWTRTSRAIAEARHARAERRQRERRTRYFAKLVETDELTGLQNRRYLKRCLREGRWHLDRRRVVSATMFDLDHFKEVNDTYGHAVGDEVLRAFCNLARAHIQPSDIAIRWGGEEVLLISPGQSLAQAWLQAEKLRAAVDRATINTEAGTMHVTASAGVATDASAAFGMDTIKHADAALYLSKGAGRNTVRPWPLVSLGRILGVASRRDAATAADRIAVFAEEALQQLDAEAREAVRRHAKRAASIADELADRAGLPKDLLVDMRIAGHCCCAGTLHRAVYRQWPRLHRHRRRSAECCALVRCARG